MRISNICINFHLILTSISTICIKRNAAERVDRVLWPCDTGGQYIGLTDFCDGTPHCADFSDETIKNCIHSKCDKLSFRCAYGACIPNSKQCDFEKNCVDGSDEREAVCQKRTHPRKLRGRCRSDNIQCKSGECIPQVDMCDGIAHCKDASDESLEFCADFYCPTLSFRCGYGACVSSEAICNGKPDCHDASDESPMMCYRLHAVSQASPPKGCRYPTNIPKLKLKNNITNVFVNFGSAVPEGTSIELVCDIGYRLSSAKRNIQCMRGSFWSGAFPHCERFTPIMPKTSAVISAPSPTTCRIPVNRPYLIVSDAFDDQILFPRHNVPANTPLKFACVPGYVLKGDSNTVCKNDGTWTQPLPSCRFFCSGKHPRSGFSTKVTFEFNGTEVESSIFEEDTKANIRCAPFFHRSIGFRETITCTKAGWRPEKVACDMKCGEPPKLLTPFSQGGENTNITEVPWHVGIYYKAHNNRFEHKCGGTLISPRIVVSAAHCFFKGQHKQYDWTPYVVAAGKYYRDYYREELNESAVARRRITSVWIHEDYEGETNGYYRDISIITLDRSISFSDFIRPACLYLPDEARQYIPSKQIGRVTAWSQATGLGSLSTLETLTVSTIDHHACSELLSNDYNITLSHDQFCLAPYGGKACKGDSGGGFVVHMPDGRYALWGIISFTPTKTQTCSRDGFLGMTNVLFYKRWLKDFKDDDLKRDVDHDSFGVQLSKL